MVHFKTSDPAVRQVAWDATSAAGGAWRGVRGLGPKHWASGFNALKGHTAYVFGSHGTPVYS